MSVAASHSSLKQGIIARGRLAPSPTGYMHLGNAFAFVMASCSARSKKGQLILRMEDIDPDRSKPEFARQIYKDLEWLGITYDEGPDRGGPFPPYQQSKCLERYTRALCYLESFGVVYPCFCTRKELRSMASAPHNEDGSTVYCGTCKQYTHDEQEQLRKKGRVACIRLNVERALALVSHANGALALKLRHASEPGFNPLLEGSQSGNGQPKAVLPIENMKILSAALRQNNYSKGDVTKDSLPGGLANACGAGVRSSLLFGAVNRVAHVEKADSNKAGHKKMAIEYEASKGLLASGDFALMRSDGVMAYQLAVVVDDAAMQITEVVRGNDLRESMSRQTLLFHLLGVGAPYYLHVPLLCDNQGERLAKRHQSLSLMALQEQGITAEAVVGFLGWVAGFFSDLRPMAMHTLVACWNGNVAEQEHIILPENTVAQLKSLSI